MNGSIHSPTAFALAGAAISLLAYPADSFGQGSALQRRLEAATRIECSFKALATGTWDGAEPAATVEPTDVEAAFFDINVGEGTAEADGRFGATFIVVRYAHGYLHFMQMSDAGPLHLTTVLAQETADGRMKAVQTRHEYSPTILPGFTSRPEMYVGDCAVTT
jgi:hypothetical protein